MKIHCGSPPTRIGEEILHFIANVHTTPSSKRTGKAEKRRTRKRHEKLSTSSTTTLFVTRKLVDFLIK